MFTVHSIATIGLIVALILGCVCMIIGTAHADISLGPGFEPTIAVNPLDPQNIAMARLGSSRVSVDGGTTWSPQTVAVAPPGYGSWNEPNPPWPPGSDACLAFDSLGRLYWSYHALLQGGGFDIFVCELNPQTGDIIGGPFFATNTAVSFNNDKQWMAADANPNSPFADRLYLGWTRSVLTGGPLRIMASYSTDHGRTWSGPLQISLSQVPFGANFAIATDGDVHLAFQAQNYPFGCNGNGSTGYVLVRRSTDGGVSYPQASLAFAAGQAEVTLNQQDCIWPIPQATFWAGTYPWILADPGDPNVIYVFAADDPDNMLGSGDYGDVYMARSTDDGATWTSPAVVSDSPPNTLDFEPTAAIDPVTGEIAVAWYDNRSGQVNPAGNWLLDWRYRTSTDGGATFSPSAAFNDAPFDPDQGVYVRFPGPPATTWIGEYFGIALGGGTLYTVWTGNGPIGDMQHTFFDRRPVSVGLPDQTPQSVPISFQLAPNAPNPFNPSTTISFDIPGPRRTTQSVSLRVYGLRGELVRVLTDGAVGPGHYDVQWDGRDDRGLRVPPGVYFYNLKVGAEAQSRKLVRVE